MQGWFLILVRSNGMSGVLSQGSDWILEGE